MATILAVALVVGFRVHSTHKQSGGEATATKQASSRPDTFQAPGSTQNPTAASNQSTASNLMARYHLDARLANFIAQAKMQVLSNDNTSIHYLLTFPDGVTSDETITITPGQRYQPTPVELQKSKGPGIQIFKPTLSAKKTGPKDTSFTLHYYVVQSSLPTDFQQWLQTSSPPLRSFEHFFELVPAAWAQQGGGDNGAESLTFNLIELAKNFEVHGLENAEMEKSAHALDNILIVKDLIKGHLEASDWLGEIGELQNCARNPTNPLAIKASQDPNYQKEVLDPLNDASSEIQMTAFPKVANIAASALTQFIPVFGLGVYIAPIVDANDEAIAEIAEGTISDAKKSVTSCEQMPEPPQKNRGDGSITFHTQLKYFNGLDKYDRFVKGDFDLVSDPTAGVGAPGRGMFRIKGTGVFTQHSESTQYHTKNKCEAQADISGHASDMMGSRMLEIGSNMINGLGDCVMESPGRVYHSSNYQDPGTVCKFPDVDLVNGGDYTVHPEGEPVWSAGTECILQLRPRPK